MDLHGLAESMVDAVRENADEEFFSICQLELEWAGLDRSAVNKLLADSGWTNSDMALVHLVRSARAAKSGDSRWARVQMNLALELVDDAEVAALTEMHRLSFTKEPMYDFVPARRVRCGFAL